MSEGRATSSASTSTVLRTPTLADAAALASVHTAIWRETYSGMMPERLLDDESRVRREQMWARILFADPVPSRTVVAEVNGELVGFASAGESFAPDEKERLTPVRELQLYAINLLAAHHGTGVGQQLLEAAIGDEPAQLWVARENPRALAFYRRNAFVLDGVEFADPSLDNLVEVRMVR